MYYMNVAFFCFHKLLTMQIITNTVYQMFIKTWYKYGLSVSFLTIENHKDLFFDMRVYFSHEVVKMVEILSDVYLKFCITPCQS